MHIHGCFAPHANCDLHTVMNSFDLWIHIFDLPPSMSGLSMTRSFHIHSFKRSSFVNRVNNRT